MLSLSMSQINDQPNQPEGSARIVISLINISVIRLHRFTSITSIGDLYFAQFSWIPFTKILQQVFTLSSLPTSSEISKWPSPYRLYQWFIKIKINKSKRLFIKLFSLRHYPATQGTLPSGGSMLLDTTGLLLCK
jgi:hypothetical protein